MSDVSLRAKWIFWLMALTAFLLAAIPSAFILDTARDYYRFVSGWQPGILRQLQVRHIPLRDSLDREPPPDIRFLEFKLEAPKARTVRLAASFNRWEAQMLPLTRTGGIWRTIVPLPPGNYEYAFEVDGVWKPDPAAPEKALAEGHEVSVLHVR